MKHSLFFLLTIISLLAVEGLSAQTKSKKSPAKSVKAAASSAEELHLKRLQQEQFAADIKKLKVKSIKP